MSEPVYEQLTLFQEDFPASHFPWLESKKVKGMTVTSGLKCSELSENLRRVGSLVRMSLESCELPLPMLCRTWSVKAMTPSCLILKLRLSERRTGANGSFSSPTADEDTPSRLWPTPKSSDAGEGWLEGGEGAQEGGLADAVGTQQAGELATADSRLEALCHHARAGFRAIADAQVFQYDGLSIHNYATKIIKICETVTSFAENS